MPQLVDGSYAPQIDLRVQLSSTYIFRSPDPFVAELPAEQKSVCLQILEDYTAWIANTWQPTYGTNDDAFLLINTVTSCAWIGTACSDSGDQIGLVQSNDPYGSANEMQFTASHELAHVLGAQDLYASQWYTRNPPTSTIPCSDPNDPNEPVHFDIMGEYGSLTFCQFSKNEIHNFVTNVGWSCLTPVF